MLKENTEMLRKEDDKVLQPIEIDELKSLILVYQLNNYVFRYLYIIKGLYSDDTDRLKITFNQVSDDPINQDVIIDIKSNEFAAIERDKEYNYDALLELLKGDITNE